jgi:hypothetical protein
LFLIAPAAEAQTRSISYQGTLTDDAGTPLNGTFDFDFELYDAASGGNQVGSTVTKTDVSVSNGVFDTSLDFGSTPFAGGEARWLEITVTDDQGNSETLTPRTKMEAAPSALSMPGVTVETGGDVGINTTNPTRQFHVAGNVLAQTSLGDAVKAEMNGLGYGVRSVVSTIGGVPGYFQITDEGSDQVGVEVENQGSGAAFVSDAFGQGEAGRFIGGDVAMLDNSGNTEFVFRSNDTNSAGQFSMFSSDGTETFDIVGDENGNDGSQVVLRQNDGTSTITLDAEFNDNGGGWLSMNNADGTETLVVRGQETSNSPSGGAVIKLYNGGASNTKTIELDPDFGGGGGNRGRITTDEMKINGSDVAEHFDVRVPGDAASAAEAGTVVSIDPDRPGKLVVSGGAYDRTVAGVISGAGGVKPGIHMGQAGTAADGDHPVAVAGRVYVKADASNGAIRPGDLLTTASTPGHAMKATDADQSQGAILGKAMTSLEEGTGLVLILVSLQ